MKGTLVATNTMSQNLAQKEVSFNGNIGFSRINAHPRGVTGTRDNFVRLRCLNERRTETKKDSGRDPGTPG